MTRVRSSVLAVPAGLTWYVVPVAPGHTRVSSCVCGRLCGNNGVAARHRRLAGAAVASLDDVQMSFLVHSGRAASGPGQCADPGILYYCCDPDPCANAPGARPRGPYLIHEATI